MELQVLQKTSALFHHASSKKLQSALERDRMSKSDVVNHSLTDGEESIIASIKAAYFMVKEDVVMVKHSAVMDLFKRVDCLAVVNSNTYLQCEYVVRACS